MRRIRFSVRVHLAEPSSTRDMPGHLGRRNTKAGLQPTHYLNKVGHGVERVVCPTPPTFPLALSKQFFSHLNDPLRNYVQRIVSQ